MISIFQTEAIVCQEDSRFLIWFAGVPDKI